MKLLRYIKYGCFLALTSLTGCCAVCPFVMGEMISSTVCCVLCRVHMSASELFDPATAALLEDIRQGNEAHAREALAGGLSLNIQGKEGVTPLTWLLLETRNKKAVRLGLKLGADPNFKNNYGSSAITLVSGFKDSEWLRMMLDAGGNPNGPGGGGETPLFVASRVQHWENMELLLARGADINHQVANYSNRTALLYAAYGNKYETVYWLMEHGARTDIYDKAGANLAELVYDSELIMQTNAPSYPWLLKVKHVLEQQGTTFPPPSWQERKRKSELNRANKLSASRKYIPLDNSVLYRI